MTRLDVARTVIPGNAERSDQESGGARFTAGEDAGSVSPVRFPLQRGSSQRSGKAAVGLSYSTDGRLWLRALVVGLSDLALAQTVRTVGGVAGIWYADTRMVAFTRNSAQVPSAAGGRSASPPQAPGVRVGERQ